MSTIVACIIGFAIAPFIWFVIGIPLLFWSAFTPAFFDSKVDKFIGDAPWWRALPAYVIAFMFVFPGMAAAAAGKIVRGNQS